MDKVYMLGKTISMDADAYHKFVSLSKEEQVNKVYNMLDPKSMEQAEELLKDVPNGQDIGNGSAKQVKKANTNPNTGAGEASSDARSPIVTGEGKRV